MTLDYHVISTLVEDKPGVLQKVAGMFNRRGFNIDSITVGKSEVEGQSRMVITVHADEKGLEQVTKQLNKLIDVIKIKDITQTAVKRELCLVKVAVPNAKARAEIMQYTNIFRAHILDVSEQTLMVELTGDKEKINAFISLKNSPYWPYSYVKGSIKMTILENVLKDNKEFVENFEGEEMSHHAAKKLAILTCMDCRLIDFFEPALGLKRGDAKIVRNAGNSIVGEDAIRSIGAALYNLGAEEVMVVGHTECGMAGADAEALKEKMLARGIKEEDIAKYDLAEWIGGFESEEENVKDVCEKIKNHPLIPDVPVHGLIIDIVTGELKVLVDGY